MKVECLVTGYSILRMKKEDVNRSYYRFFKWERGRRINSESRLVHLATFQAVEMADVDFKRVRRSRVGIVLSTSFGGLESYEEFLRSIKSNNPQPNAFSNSLANIPTAVVSIFYGITGPSITLSSLIGINALILSMEMVCTGLCDIAIAGAWYMPSLSSMKLAPGSDSGAGIIVIESPEHAKRRSATVIARITALSNEMIGNADLIVEAKSNKREVKKTKGEDIPGVSSLLPIIEGLEKIEKKDGTGKVVINRFSKRVISVCPEGSRHYETDS